MPGGWRRAADAIGLLRSLVFTIPLIYLHTILMGLISFVLAPFDRGARLQHGCARLWARMILWTSFVRLRVHGAENIDPQRGYVYVSNHQSYIDTPIVFAALPTRFCIMAKASVFHIPFLGWHLQRTGNLPIPRNSPLTSARRLLQATSAIRQGRSLFVFPEGGRNPEPAVGEFRHGIFMAAIQAGVPVVPITIRGSRPVLDYHSWTIRPGTVEVIIDAPLETVGMDKRQAEELCERTRSLIVARFG